MNPHYGKDGHRQTRLEEMWVINCGIETDFWIQALTDFDRGAYGVLTPESAYDTRDDSLIPQLPINPFPTRSNPEVGVRLHRVK